MWKKTIGYYVCIGCICLSYYSGLGLLFHLDFVRSLSDAWYYFWLAIATACHVALLTFVIYKHKEKLIIVKPQFKWSYLGYSVAGFVMNLLWNALATLIFPHGQNQNAINEVLQSIRGAALFWGMWIILGILAPIWEELIYRGVVMTALKRFQRFRLDLIVSASLFSMGHIVQFGWSTTDFILYFVPGLILGWVFRKTNGIYYSMATHVAWNSFLALLYTLSQR